MVGDLRREFGMTPGEIAAIGHRDLAHAIAGLSPNSAYAAAVGDRRQAIDDPADAQQFIDRYL